MPIVKRCFLLLLLLVFHSGSALGQERSDLPVTLRNLVSPFTPPKSGIGASIDPASKGHDRMSGTLNFDRDLHKPASAHAEILTNVKAEWSSFLDTSQTMSEGLGAHTFFLQDSILTIVGRGFYIGTQVVRINIDGTILHVDSRLPFRYDTVWRLYYTCNDARMLDNGDIRCAGIVEGWRRHSIRGIGAIANYTYTSTNQFTNLGPHRYYTHASPAPVPTDVNRINPYSGCFGQGDTAFFAVHEVDWQPRPTYHLFGRTPGRHALDTALIVRVPHNSVDTFISTLRLDDLAGHSGIFRAFGSTPVFFRFFRTARGLSYTRFTILNSDLTVQADCVVDSLGLMAPAPYDDETFYCFSYDESKGGIVRRRISKSCSANAPEHVYATPAYHDIRQAFFRRNGNVILSGGTATDETGAPANSSVDYFKGFAMELTPRGQVVWRYQRGLDKYETRVTGVTELPDASFIVTGTFNFGNAFITRIRPDATMSSTDDASEAKDARVVLSPNPLGPGEELSLRLPESGVFDLELMDMSGRVAHRLPSLRFEAHTSQGIPCPELSAGSYMLVARSQARYFATRLVKY